MRVTKSVTKDILHNKEIIIYGAGTCGEIALRGLEEWGVQVSYLCDANENIHEKWGIAVIPPKELRNHREAVIILASLNYFYEMYAICSNMGLSNYYDMEQLFLSPIPDTKLSYQAQDVFANKARYVDILNHSPEENRLSIGKIEVTVSELCSLKCKDCSYLMPYYKHPSNVEINSCIDGVDRLLKLTDHISELRLLGGEPFLNSGLYIIVNRYSNNDKIGIIDIHTNGTLIPDERTLDALKHDKVVVHISDYGVPQNKIKKLVELFDGAGVKYFVRKYDEWLSMGEMSDQHYSNKELLQAFSKCTARNCFTIKENRLYHCPRSAHATSMGMIPDFPEDYFDLEQEGQTKDKLKLYLTKKHPVNACQYCKGGNVSARVPAALQA